MNSGLHIALAPERLFFLWGAPITNTLLAQWCVMLTLLIIAVVVGRNPSLIPTKVQNFFEMIFDFILGYMEQILGTRALAIRFFPLVVTIFIFIALQHRHDINPATAALLAVITKAAVTIGQVAFTTLIVVGVLLWFSRINKHLGKGLVEGGIVIFLFIEFFLPWLKTLHP